MRKRITIIKKKKMKKRKKKKKKFLMKKIANNCSRIRQYINKKNNYNNSQKRNSMAKDLGKLMIEILLTKKV